MAGFTILGDEVGLAVLGTLKAGLAIQGLFGHISFLQKKRGYQYPFQAI